MKLDVPYAKAALPCLVMYEKMTQEEAEQFVLSNDFDGIENKAWASSSVIPAAEFYGKMFHLSEHELEEFKQETLGKTDSTRITDMMRSAVEQMSQNEKDKIAVTLAAEATQYVHDTWRKDNAKKFFDPNRAAKQFQHCATELIGLSEQSLDHRYILPVGAAVGLSVDREELEMELINRAVAYVERGIEEHGSLTDFIVAEHANDPVLREDVREVFANRDFVEQTMIPQLFENGFGHDDLTICTLQCHGMDIEEFDRIDPDLQTPGNR